MVPGAPVNESRRDRVTQSAGCPQGEAGASITASRSMGFHPQGRILQRQMIASLRSIHLFAVVLRRFLNDSNHIELIGDLCREAISLSARRGERVARHPRSIRNHPARV